MNSKNIEQAINDAPQAFQEIILYIRAVVREACPQVIEEIKWGHLSFNYHGILCSVNHFKAHCSFGFWKYELMQQQFPIICSKEISPMYQFGKIKTIEDLPEKEILIDCIKYAMLLNENKISTPKKKNTKLEPIETPYFIEEILRKNSDAHSNFNAMSNSCRKEYIEWICDAKKEETKQKRIAKAIEMLQEGKNLNWKYS
jgi:hypothetical protein